MFAPAFPAVAWEREKQEQEQVELDVRLQIPGFSACQMAHPDILGTPPHVHLDENWC